MAMVEITRNGITTIENWLTEVKSTLTDDERHEFVLWNDGSLTIDAITDEGPSGDHVSLDMESVRQLRNFLNSQRITEMLATA